jgi:hypothetical protein
VEISAGNRHSGGRNQGPDRTWIQRLLIVSTEACAECMVELLTDRMMAERIGAAAKRVVRERFLIPRLVQDHLQLYGEVGGTQASTATAA